VVVTLVAVAWFLSGRTRKLAPARNPDGEAKCDEGKAMRELRTRTGQFPGGVG
jgi:hypothetical protein